MKVLLINGSRRDNGCTHFALSIVAEALEKEGVGSEIIDVGNRVLKGEVRQVVKEVADRLDEFQGIVVGSPVYYASPTGEIISFLDQLFGAAEAKLRFMPAATIASARRGGTTATLDVLNKYFLYNQMPLIASRYWNMVHGNTPDEVKQDLEGVQIMQTLGRNMAWILQSIESGKKNGVKQPEAEDKIFVNFINN